MLVSVIGILLLDVTGAIPKASVGGAMTMFFAFLVAMFTLGVYEAISNKRGVFGWIVSIVCALVGGLVAALVGAQILDEILPLMKLDGPLVTSQHPMRYLAPAGMMIFTLLGSWAALKIVNRFR